MPTNVTPEYALAQKKYLEAKTRQEKIGALEEMIRTAPKHKGAANLLAQLKQRLAKLKSQSQGKAARTAFSMPKEGDVQVAIVGFTQSGKSTMLSKLTNAKPEISSRNYTTTKPEVGMAEWKGVKMQMVEIPSTMNPMYMSVSQNADGVIYVYDGTKDIKEQSKNFRTLRERFRLVNIPYINVRGRQDTNSENIFSKLWEKLGLIKVYTKEPGKDPEKRALVLDKGATVQEAAAKIHKDFIKFFQYARVWGSTKFSGEKVGLLYELKDDDVLEVHA